jgi:hypothetical protein
MLTKAEALAAAERADAYPKGWARHWSWIPKENPKSVTTDWSMEHAWQHTDHG